MLNAASSSFVEAAKGLAPQIQASADEIERSRRLPLHLVDAMAQAGLFRVWIPRSLGGEETDPIDRGRSIFFFFGGFAELLLGRAHEAIVLLQKSLERNPTHGSAQLFLVAALSLTGQHCEAASMADSFRQKYLESPANAFEEFWLSRSASPVYRAQVFPLFDSILRVAAV